MSEIIRDVIIRTRVEHQKSRGGSGAGGPQSDRVTGSKAAAQQKQATADEMKSVKQVASYRIDMAKNIHNLRFKNAKQEATYRIDMAKKEAAQQKEIAAIANKRREAEANHAKIKLNSLRLEKEINESIMRDETRRSLGFKNAPQMSGRMMGIRDVVEQRLAHRAMTNQPANIGGRKSGGAVTKGGSFLETGIGPLDFANRIGFQAFITMMTVRMIGNALGGMANSAAGFSGEGEGIIAQATRALSGDPRSKRDPIRTYIGDTTGDIMRGLGGVGGGEAASALGLGFRGQRIIDQGQNISSRAKMLAEGRMTSAMREEDRMLKQKRELLQMELSVLGKRIDADQSDANRAVGKRESAIQAYGRLSAEDMKFSDALTSKLAGGATPADLSKEEREFMIANPSLYGDMNNVFAHESAFKGNVKALLNLNQGGFTGSSFNGQMNATQKELTQSRMDFSKVNEMSQPVFNAQLNIERLELDSQQIIDAVNDLLAPQWEKELEVLRGELDAFKQRIREDFKAGGGIGSNPNFQVAPPMSFRP